MSTLAEKWLKKGLDNKYQPPSTFIGLLWKRNYGFINRKLINSSLEIAEFFLLSLICDQKYLEQIIALTVMQILFNLSMDSFLTINRRLAFHNGLIKIEYQNKLLIMLSLAFLLPLSFYSGGKIILIMVIYRLLTFLAQITTFIKTLEAQSTQRIYISPWKIFSPKLISLSVTLPFISRSENQLGTLIFILVIFFTGKCLSEYNFYKTIKEKSNERIKRDKRPYEKPGSVNLLAEITSYLLPYLELFIIYSSIGKKIQTNYWSFLLIVLFYRAINRPLKSIQLDLNYLKRKGNDIGVNVLLENTIKFQWFLCMLIITLISLSSYKAQLTYASLSLFCFFIFQDLLSHKVRIENDGKFLILIKLIFFGLIIFSILTNEIMITSAQLFGFYLIITVYLMTKIFNIKANIHTKNEPIYLAEIEKKKKFISKGNLFIQKIKILNNTHILLKSNLPEHELIHELWKTYPLNLKNSELKKFEVPPKMSNHELKIYFLELKKIIDNSYIHIFRENKLKFTSKRLNFINTIHLGQLFKKCFKNSTYLGSKAILKLDKNYYFYGIDQATFIIIEKNQFSEKDLDYLDSQKLKFIGYTFP